MKTDLQALLEEVVALARRAGLEILRVYRGEVSLDLTSKADHSPVTRADKSAHETILAGLVDLTPDVQVLSEEGTQLSDDSPLMWLVDPLDGTREFLAGNGEFTVNIALLEDGRPVLGVIHVPVQDTVYAGAVGLCAWFEQHNRRMAFAPRPLPSIARPPKVAVSRSQGELSLGPCRDALAKRYPGYTVQGVGSALKFCELAAARADVYPRFSPTCAWDTAAGQALLESVGGAVIDYLGEPLQYHAASQWRNGDFLAVADRSRDWSFMWSRG